MCGGIPHNGLFLLKLEDLLDVSGNEDDADTYAMIAHAVKSEKKKRNRRYTLPSGEAGPTAYSVAADLNTWHERLGHIAHEAVRLIYEADRVDGFDVVGSLKHKPGCQCPTCSMTKSTHKHPPKVKVKPFDPRSHKPLGTVYTDIRHVGAESLSGAKYMITFVCACTRHTSCFFLPRKSDASAAFREYLAFARREGFCSQRMRKRRGRRIIFPPGPISVQDRG